MERMIDDEVKQKLLNSLAEEPAMVISTAYVYAKNYVMYGEDITKAWTTAVQQASVIQEVRQKAWVEAYDSFKKDYENRLKADMVAMLTEIQLEIDELPTNRMAITDSSGFICYGYSYDEPSAKDASNLIQQKIDALKGEDNVSNPETD